MWSALELAVSTRLSQRLAARIQNGLQQLCLLGAGKSKRWRSFNSVGFTQTMPWREKSKQCSRQVHDVLQRQKTFDLRAGGSKIEHCEEPRHQAIMGHGIAKSEFQHLRSFLVLLVQKGSEGKPARCRQLQLHTRPRHPKGQGGQLSEEQYETWDTERNP